VTSDTFAQAGERLIRTHRVAIRDVVEYVIDHLTDHEGLLHTCLLANLRVVLDWLADWPGVERLLLALGDAALGDLLAHMWARLATP
jgi:hypothetical protein